MSERPEKRPSEFLLDLINSDMNLARAFAAVSRAAYRLGKTEQGNFARLKAIQLYSEAAKLVPQLPDTHREGSHRELLALSATINWLFMKSIAPVEANLEANEFIPLENPPIALG